MNEEVKEEKFEENVEANLEEETSNTEKNEHKEHKKEVKNRLKLENKALKEEVANLTNDLLKNRAELANFKKRINEENIKNLKYANQDLIAQLLTPLEFLDKACNFETDNQDLKNFLIGFQMINKQLFDILINNGLEEIKVSVGDEFDPQIHHAMDSLEEKGTEPNKVIEVLRKGYKYKDRIIQPAMVNVSK